MLLPFFSCCCRWARHRQQATSWGTAATSADTAATSNIRGSSSNKSHHDDGDSKMSGHDYALHILDDDEVAGRSLRRQQHLWGPESQSRLLERIAVWRCGHGPVRESARQPAVLSPWPGRHIPRHLINECEGQFRFSSRTTFEIYEHLSDKSATPFPLSATATEFELALGMCSFR